MRLLLAATVAFGAARLQAQTSPTTQEMRDIFPADARPEQFVLSADGARTYFLSSMGEVWLYDRTSKTRTRVVSGGVSDLNLSPKGDALAYAKPSGRQGDANVWIIKLNSETGLANGAERQLSTASGDVPAISPDGKLVAFARDDASGVGQSIVVVPIGGGTERVVAPAQPSNVGNIRWTPDGKSLVFGVNVPVACVPEWSCLPLAGANRQPAGSIRRVASSGGAVTVVAAARGVFPGLSPDGHTLMYIDTGSVRRWVVADADGRRRDLPALPSLRANASWLKGSTILMQGNGNASASMLAIDLSAPRGGNDK